MVPVNRSETILDLAVKLGFRAVIVADNKLGVINHTLLTAMALQQASVAVAGVVFNQSSPRTDTNSFIRDDNPQAIARAGNIPVLGELPHLEDWRPDAACFWQKRR